jgi:archaemetzincin
MRYLYVGATSDVQDRIDREALTLVRDRVSSDFGLPAREMEVPAIEFAFDAGRRQYGSIPVLEMLGRICPPDALKLLAITGRDLFIPVLTFVYGHAQLGGKVAVISLARLKQEFYGLPPNREVFLERAFKEALHETGHTFGLVHCPDRSCAMALGTNIRQIDSKHARFCASCAARWERRPKE